MDCITLLKNLVKPGRLSASARSYALNLMEQVEADQRWGVGVDADAGTDFANKNGWLSIDNNNGPGENDNGLWAVNSVGVIRINGQQVLMAVMTKAPPRLRVRRQSSRITGAGDQTVDWHVTRSDDAQRRGGRVGPAA